MVKEFQNWKQGDRDLSSRLDAFEASMNKKLQDLNSTVNQPPTPWTETMSMHAKPARTELLGTERGGSLDKKYEELERSNKLLSVRVSELELQLIYGRSSGLVDMRPSFRPHIPASPLP